ncbi:hypothetical protein Tco_0525125 [Tanacetum coccineum]
MLASMKRKLSKEMEDRTAYDMGKTLGTLHAMLKTAVKNVPSKNVVPSMIREGGHAKSNRPSYLVELKKNKISWKFWQTRNAIFEIDMDGCRLGRINKKHVKKLQSNGVLEPTKSDSLDIFEPCLCEKKIKAPLSCI